MVEPDTIRLAPVIGELVELSIVFALMALMVVPLFVFHIWALVDLLKMPTTAWETAEQNEIVWAIVVLALAFVGPILYLVIARPQLLAAKASSS